MIEKEYEKNIEGQNCSPPEGIQIYFRQFLIKINSFCFKCGEFYQKLTIPKNKFLLPGVEYQ